MNSSGFVAHHVRRTNRNLVLLGVAALVALAALFAAGANTVRNRFSGPFPISQRDLSAIGDAADARDYFISVEGEEAFDTGFEEITTRSRAGIQTSQSTSAKYSLLLLSSGKFVLVSHRGAATDAELESPDITGEISAFSTVERRDIIPGIEKEAPELKGKILPFKLNANSGSATAWVIIVAGVALAALALWALLNAMMRMQNSAAHPITKSLAELGNVEPNTIQLDFEAGDVRSNVLVTPNWLFQSSAFTGRAVKLTDVIWAHLHAQSTRGGTVYSLSVYGRDGKKISVPAGHAWLKGEAKARALLDQIGAKAPWVAKGYSDELERLWKKERESFMAQIDARRVELGSPRAN